MPRTDSADIKRQLTERLESVLDSYWPGWVYGPAKRSGFPEPKGRHDLGSFEVYLTGAKRGEWFRRSQGIGGDPINLLAYGLTGNHKAYREAFAEAAAFLGLPAQEPRQRPAVAKESPIQAEPSREERRAAAFKVWQGAKPLPDTLGADYLFNRGIRYDLTPFTRVRYHRGLRYDHPSKAWERLMFPGLVAAVQGPDMRFRGVWRIFLSALGDKAALDHPKLGMGPCRSGGVWLGEQSPSVNVCEGLETGFGVRGLSGGTVVCLLSTAGMRGWEPPPFVRSVLIWPDGDRERIQVTERGERRLPSPGLSAAEALRERLTASGLHCTVQPTPEFGKDYLDAWNEWEAVREG